MPASPHPDRLRLNRRTVLGLGAALALGGAGLSRVCAQAPHAGAEAAPPFKTLDLDWVDAARDRAVPVRLYLPDADQAVPLLAFSHGIGGSRLGYSYLGRHLASHGIASLHLQHVGSDRQVWFGNPFGLVGRLQKAADESEARARAADLRFALDRVLASGPLAERIDARRLAAGGHSYGANTSMLVAGARVQREGRVLPLQDERLRGVLLLSAPPFYGEPDLAAVLGAVQVPALHLTTTEDVINVPGYHSPAEDRLAIYRAMGSPRKALAVFEGGSHSIFTDRSGPGGPELNARVKQATQDLALGFLQGLFATGTLDRPALAGACERHRNLIAQLDIQA